MFNIYTELFSYIQLWFVHIAKFLFFLYKYSLLVLTQSSCWSKRLPEYIACCYCPCLLNPPEVKGESPFWRHHAFQTHCPERGSWAGTDMNASSLRTNFHSARRWHTRCNQQTYPAMTPTKYNNNQLDIQLERYSSDVYTFLLPTNS